jgi:hypothetical protein
VFPVMIAVDLVVVFCWGDFLQCLSLLVLISFLRQIFCFAHC